MADDINLNLEEDADDDFQRLLNDFISSELSEIETGLEKKEIPAPKPQPKVKKNDGEEDFSFLKEDERNLYNAFLGFKQSIDAICEAFEITKPAFKSSAKILFPNFKPSIGKVFAEDTIIGWDVLLKAYGKQMEDLSPSSTDDQLLDFAEGCSDNSLTLSIISYVETVIEIESCEIHYEGKRLQLERKKIEQDILKEHQKRIEKSKKYIAKIEKKKFPIDAEKLVINYFKTAQKDPEGAYQALIKNPAIFSPILTNKIKPRFFGLIKPTPEDGILINQEIGKFLKRLKA